MSTDDEYANYMRRDIKTRHLHAYEVFHDGLNYEISNFWNTPGLMEALVDDWMPVKSDVKIPATFQQIILLVGNFYNDKLVFVRPGV